MSDLSELINALPERSDTRAVARAPPLQRAGRLALTTAVRGVR
ncbi:MAG TPA: hypothetical protein VGH89_02470 [Pseudonocardia sp.]|jgi:hypothetical protein